MTPLLAALALAQPPTVPDSPAAPAATAPAADPARYYFLLFGSDAGPLRPAATHTWATYCKVTPAGGGRQVEHVTVSWLPADLTIHARRPLKPEAGANIGLHDTLRLVAGQGQQTTLFGPYEVDAARYAVAQTEKELLDSGRVSYRPASSPRGMPPGLSNCITAVAAVEPALDRSLPLLQFGRRGTAKAARTIEATDSSVRKAPDADWLLPALGLDKLPITRSR